MLCFIERRSYRCLFTWNNFENRNRKEKVVPLWFFFFLEAGLMFTRHHWEICQLLLGTKDFYFIQQTQTHHPERNTPSLCHCHSFLFFPTEKIPSNCYELNLPNSIVYKHIAYLIHGRLKSCDQLSEELLGNSTKKEWQAFLLHLFGKLIKKKKIFLSF